MNATVTRIIGVCSAVIMTVAAAGCSSELKYLAINQLVGFATAITSAASTNLLQSLFAGGV